MPQSPEDHFVIGVVHHARLHIDQCTAYSAFAFSSSMLYKFAISLAAEACNVTQIPFHEIRLTGKISEWVCYIVIYIFIFISDKQIENLLENPFLLLQVTLEHFITISKHYEGKQKMTEFQLHDHVT
jgi:hypothetical protein